jgi:hypothetical protein
VEIIEKENEMSKLELTKDLKDYKAIVLYKNESLPKGYISISGTFFDGREIEIAIPEELMKNIDLVNKLANQAQDCLFRLMFQ